MRDYTAQAGLDCARHIVNSLCKDLRCENALRINDIVKWLEIHARKYGCWVEFYFHKSSEHREFPQIRRRHLNMPPVQVTCHAEKNYGYLTCINLLRQASIAIVLANFPDEFVDDLSYDESYDSFSAQNPATAEQIDRLFNELQGTVLN